RFALMDARLMRQSYSNARDPASRQSFRAQLVARVTDVMELVTPWDAPALRDQIHKEFEDLIPKQVEIYSDVITPAIEQGIDASRKQTFSAMIRTFGPLAIEKLSPESDSNLRSAGPAEGAVDAKEG